MSVEWKQYITSDPEILRGKPRIKGTRIPASLILGYLAVGKTADEISAEFPDSPASKSPPASTTRATWLNSRPPLDGVALLRRSLRFQSHH